MMSILTIGQDDIQGRGESSNEACFGGCFDGAAGVFDADGDHGDHHSTENTDECWTKLALYTRI